MTPSRTLLLVLGVLIPATLAAQQAGERRPAPLSKSDLVRMLSRGTYSPTEVVAMIQRSCLSFLPNLGDRQDLRRLGATASMLAAMDDCVSRTTSPPSQEPSRTAAQPLPEPRPEPPRAPTRDFAAPSTAPLLAAPSTAWLIARVQEGASLTVEVRRGQSPQVGVRLVLRGTEHIAEGPADALQATTDEQGMARFEIPAGPAIQRYPLRLAAIGEELSGQTSLTLEVVAAGPVWVDVDPNPLVLSGRSVDPAILTATAFDRFGNRVGRAELTLRARAIDAEPGASLPPEITRTTDENGTALFVVRTASLRDGYLLDLYSEGVALASIPVRFETVGPNPEESRAPGADTLVVIATPEEPPGEEQTEATEATPSPAEATPSPAEATPSP